MAGISLISIDAGKLEGPIILGMAGLAGFVLWRLHMKDQAAQSVTASTADPNAAALATRAADVALFQQVGLLQSNASAPSLAPVAANTVAVGTATPKGGTV